MNSIPSLDPWTEPERRVFRSREGISVSDWAARYRWVVQTDYEGRWRTDLSPWASEPMNCFNDPYVQEVILCWAPQIAKTQVAFNWLMYAVDQDPGPAMYVMPDQHAAGRICDKRIIPSLRATPRVASLLGSRVDDVSKFFIRFKTMDLMMAWAGSASVLSSEPARIVILDEIEKYPRVTERETDPLDLARARTKGYPHTKKILYLSTPANEGDSMDRLLKQWPDETRDYHVPCPVCGHEQRMLFDNFTWPGGDTANARSILAHNTAWYSCISCGMKWDDMLRNDAVHSERGRWVARTPCDTGRPRAIAYHLPSWYSQDTLLAEVVASYLRSVDDPTNRRTFITQHKAEPYVDTIERKVESELAQNRIDLEPLICPAGTVGVTMFIDPGKQIYWYGAIAWRRDMSAHLVHYGYVTTWDEVRQLLHETTYRVDGASDIFLPIWRAGIDTGGGLYEGMEETMTEEAYDFIRQHGAGKLIGTKGKGQSFWSSGRKLRMNVIDRTPKKKPIPGGINLWTLNVDAFKDSVHYRLSLPEGHPGRLTFHGEAGPDLYAQLAAEEKKRDKYGRAVWVKTGKHNHYLDVLVGNFALADPEAAGGIAVRRTPSHESPQPPPDRGPGFVSKILPPGRRGGFVKQFRR